VTRPDSDLAELLRAAFGIDADTATPILDAGDECLLWHVAAPRSLVVRAAPPWRSAAELRWAYQVAGALREYVPEVVVPASPVIARWRGRAVTIWPYAPGRQLDRHRPDDRFVAAALLARLHQATLAIPDPGRRPASEIGGPADRTGSEDRDGITDPDLDTTLARWLFRGSRSAPRGAVHGDFYPRNIHVHEPPIGDGGLALLDWDDARVDVLGAELAWAAWEFCHDDDTVEMSDLAVFLDAYRRAGGPPYEPEMIVPWIRERLRLEIARNRSAALAGEYHDTEYEAMEVRAFAKLRGVAFVG
jgi:Ser/Thr protein kinase RdoA (MazF antagonist)